jgi:hypothetical protein
LGWWGVWGWVVGGVVVVINYFLMSKPQDPEMPGSKFHFISVRCFALKILSNSEVKYKAF